MKTPNLTPSQSKIWNQLQWLSNHFTDEQHPYFWQHINRLAKSTHTSRRTVQSALKHFVDLGVLEVLKNVGVGYTNAYRVILDATVKIVHLSDLFQSHSTKTNSQQGFLSLM
ncbi:hypothetical protein VCRA2110O135_200040 [Vibrio crassostreae]|nr:hypothetical protein VCRA2110O135_200040 [Vibrio crassostreae]